MNLHILQKKVFIDLGHIFLTILFYPELIKVINPLTFQLTHF